MQLLLQLLLAMIFAAGSSAKSGPMQAPETRQSTSGLALPSPDTVNGLRPFQFPTDYNQTADYLPDGIPEVWLYCTKTSEYTNPDFVDTLLNNSVLLSTQHNGTIPFQTGWVWHYPLDRQSSQVYVCNHNRRFSFSISVGVFYKVNGWLDEICGISIAGYAYLGMPWDVAIGRNSTDVNGYPKPECGGKWASDAMMAPN